MLILLINGDEFKLSSDIKKQMQLKRELLSRYRPDDKVTIQAKGKTIDECKIDELFEYDEIKDNLR